MPFIVFLFFLLLISDAPADTARMLERELARSAGSREAPGMVLVVATQGDVAFLGAAGFADREARTRMEITTPLPLGELTRGFTAALALDLAAAGVIDMDATIAPWIGADEVEFDPSGVTLRQLLSHQAGLPPTRLHGMYRDTDTAAQPEGALLATDFYQALPPGQLVSASSLGYVLAARVLERAANSDYATLLSDRLLTPLDMATTGFSDNIPLPPTHRRGRPQPGLIARDHAAVGLVANAEDLGRWLAALTAPQSPLADRDALFRVQNRTAMLGLDEAMGLGFVVTDSPVEGTGRLAFAFSSYPGYHARLRIAVDHGVAVLAISNGYDAHGPLGELLDKAFDAHLARNGQAVEQAHRVRERVPDSVPWPTAAKRIAPATRYATAFGMIQVSPANEGFDAEVFGRRFSAQPRGDGWLRVRYRLFGVIPLAFNMLNRMLIAPAEVDGYHVLLAWFQGRTLLLGSAFDVPALPTRARALSGDWTLEAPDALVEQLEIRSARITVEDGLLMLIYELPFILTLRPRLALGMTEDGHLRLLGFGPSLGERIRVGRDDEGDWLEYSGYRLRRARTGSEVP